MSALTLCSAETGAMLEHLSHHATIAARLAELGVQFERWEADLPLGAEAGQEEVLAAYAPQVEQLRGQYGFRSVDVVSLTPAHPQKAELRGKFLAEHTHDDFEVRFFVDGRGLFYLHLGERVYLVLCERGDLISVPAGTTHWFDMGAEPSFKCIRFFTIPDGWVGHFTGDSIPGRLPDFDAYLARLPQ
jgi:1,2-dihydroxy-3-keto-5-methylthiopentene dioxygenase